MPENVRARTARATSALLLTLAFALLYALALAALCSGAALALVGARHQAENATQLDAPTWAITDNDESSDEGTHVRFKEIADSSDKVRFNVSTQQAVNEIQMRVRLSGDAKGDDRLAVWINGTATANKVPATVLPPVGNAWATRTIALASPLPAGSHAIYVGPNQRNDAFVAFDWMELHGPTPPPPPDADGDGVPDASDNCPNAANAGQADADGDGLGDACDAQDNRDSDGDGVQNHQDACPGTAPGTAVGSDGCAVPPPPSDSDGDGVEDAQDACPDTPAGTAVGSDGCPVPDPEPTGDTDGDGVDDSEDGCDDRSNPARTNGGCPWDADGTPAPDRVDYDRDGILDSVDPITGRELGNPDYGVTGSARAKAHCEVYATNHVDPIAFASHLHRPFGNTNTTNETDGYELRAMGRTATSCDSGWLTSAGWFPVEADGDDPNNTHKTVNGVNVYYRGFDDERLVQDLPTNLQLLTQDQKYAVSPATNFTDAPPYGTSRNWSTRNIFPDCVDLTRMTEEAVNAVDSDNLSRCPASHPYRIPQINQLITHSGPVPNPLVVSMGVDQWGPWEMMHGDYLVALQPEFNEDTEFGPALIDYCIREGRGQQTGPERCGNEPG